MDTNTGGDRRPVTKQDLYAPTRVESRDTRANEGTPNTGGQAGNRKNLKLSHLLLVMVLMHFLQPYMSTYQKSKDVPRQKFFAKVGNCSINEQHRKRLPTAVYQGRMTDQTNDKRSHCPSSLATTCIPCKAPNWSWLWRHRGAVLNTATTCTSFMLFLACIRCLRRTSAISPIFHCTVWTIVHSCPETAAARVARKLQGLQGPLDQNVAKKMSCQFKKPQSKTKSWQQKNSK